MKKRIFDITVILCLMVILLVGCQPLPVETSEAETQDSETGEACPIEEEAGECPTQKPCPTQAAVEEATCPTAEPCPSCVQEVETSAGMVKISGEFDYSNDYVLETYMVEHLVALVDMTGFVLRDVEWELPIDSQVLGYVDVDAENNHGEYFINLPAQPAGILNDVNPDGKKETGVQIYAISYFPNLSGDPFSVGDDRSLGWPNYLASMVTDSENNDEVIGGKLLVWAPDAKQLFPTGYGKDGLLFTDDDPTGKLPAGYSVIDLDQEPFGISQENGQQIALYEPQDVAIKDYSAMSYSDAFKQMVDVLRVEYAFNGIEGKAPDWDALYEEIAPKVKEAEINQDPSAYYLALREFIFAFKDGHVGLSSADSLDYPIFMEETAGGFGFAIRELDDGSVIVTYILEGGPAAEAGMKLGAVVTEWNGEPIADAVSKVQSLSAPFSTDFAERYQQLRYLLRVPLGTEAEVTFTNPDEQAKTVKLTSVDERDSFSATSIYATQEDSYLPVDYKILDSGVGYVRITSNYDDLNLVVRLFERALQTFQASEVYGIIIDLRYNSGGSPLGLAGFLTDKEIVMGQLSYYSDKTAQFEPEGIPEKVYPNQNQYSFDKMVLMVGQACYSACEIEAYGFSQVPGMEVVGIYPSGGVEAEVSRGQFALPAGMSLQFPTGRFTLSDGSLFLEGTGVQPTVRIPLTAETVLATDDVELAVAEQTILKPAGAGITPEKSPTIITGEDAEAQLLAGASFFEDAAREDYSEADFTIAGQTFTYTIGLSQSAPMVLAVGWCATDAATLAQNLEHIRAKFLMEGVEIPADKISNYKYDPEGMSCNLDYVVLDDWSAGEHHFETQLTFDTTINDGSSDYQAGTTIYQYSVYVKP